MVFLYCTTWEAIHCKEEPESGQMTITMAAEPGDGEPFELCMTRMLGVRGARFEALLVQPVRVRAQHIAISPCMH